jgi:sorbitol-specific phosphotransferase system component IIC
MEATLAMASLGRFNPDEPHFKMAINRKTHPIYGPFTPENIPGILFLWKF